jgi:dolichol-phosphate mannosyltransferase
MRTEDQMTDRTNPISGRKIWIVLPAFNEEKDLGHLLERIDDAMAEIRLPFELVIVDDGSTDNTAAVIAQWSEKLAIKCIQHEVNLGLGATIRDGLRAASDYADARDVIITLDADNSHTPELILRMVRLVREGHDVVIASRFRPGSRVRGVPVHRRILSLAAGILLKLVFPIPGVRDYTCGYRAYRAGVLQRVTENDPDFFDQEGFQVMVDILLKLRRDKDLVFGEAPLILRYDHKSGASKMDIGSTITGTLSLMLRRRFR